MKSLLLSVSLEGSLRVLVAATAASLCASSRISADDDDDDDDDDDEEDDDDDEEDDENVEGVFGITAVDEAPEDGEAEDE